MNRFREPTLFDVIVPNIHGDKESADFLSPTYSETDSRITSTAMPPDGR
jgi:hypothetical protein